MICPWSSVSLPPIGVPSDYELDVDWPLVLPDLPNDDDDEEPDEDDEEELLGIAACCPSPWSLVWWGLLSWALRLWVSLR